MYTKQNLIDSIANEFRILKHLAEKIPADIEGYKPTEGQRTILELLQYLSVMGTAMMRAVLENDTTLFAGYMEISKGTTRENFIEKINTEESEMKEFFVKFTDEEFETVITRFGTTKSKALFLLDLLKMLAAYKMQLFLYIKASGNTSLGTSNLWGGMDMPQS